MYTDADEVIDHFMLLLQILANVQRVVEETIPAILLEYKFKEYLTSGRRKYHTKL